MVEIACDRKGTHSLQALVALVSRDSEEQLLRETLQNHIVELSFVKYYLFKDRLMTLGSSRNTSCPKIDCFNLFE